MTDKQMKNYTDAHPYFIRGEVQELTEEEKQMHREIWAREMINSIMIYGTTDVDRCMADKYMKDYIEELGYERCKELAEEQKADIDRSKIASCVYTDSDGCTYNSIRWYDEV